VRGEVYPSAREKREEKGRKKHKKTMNQYHPWINREARKGIPFRADEKPAQPPLYGYYTGFRKYNSIASGKNFSGCFHGYFRNGKKASASPMRSNCNNPSLTAE
jgi:hypothetical protein